MPDKTATTAKPKQASFADINLSDADWAFTTKILSSEAFAAQIITRIKRGIPTSAIRLSDGEKQVALFSRGAPLAYFLKDPVWLERYGLLGANIASVGKQLIEACEKADYAGCTISGLFLPNFRCHDVFPPRSEYIDNFFPCLWQTTGRLSCVLAAADILVMHRDCAAVTASLSKLTPRKVSGFKLNSWHDHDTAIKTCAASGAGLVLVSGGPAGKPLCVRLAKETGKVVLDVGEALQVHWAR